MKKKIKSLLALLLAVLMMMCWCVSAWAAVPVVKTGKSNSYSYEKSAKYSYDSKSRTLTLDTNTYNSGLFYDGWMFAPLVDYSKIAENPTLLVLFNETGTGDYCDSFESSGAVILAYSDLVKDGKIQKIIVNGVKGDDDNLQEDSWYYRLNVSKGLLQSCICESETEDGAVESTINFRYFPNGKLKSITSADYPGEDFPFAKYGYNKKGQLNKVTLYDVELPESDDDPLIPVPYNCKVSYDKQGRIVGLTSEINSSRISYKNGTIYQIKNTAGDVSHFNNKDYYGLNTFTIKDGKFMKMVFVHPSGDTWSYQYTY